MVRVTCQSLSYVSICNLGSTCCTDVKGIVEAIDSEILRLQQARSLLTGNTAGLKRRLPRPASSSIGGDNHAIRALVLYHAPVTPKDRAGTTTCSVVTMPVNAMDRSALNAMSPYPSVSVFPESCFLKSARSGFRLGFGG
jgi:hypothetical protein